MTSVGVVVTINVGGRQYKTSGATLQKYPGSSVTSMYNGSKSNVVHVDGDGTMFRHVLNFMRQSKLLLPGDFKEWELLESEAKMYRLYDMVDAVRGARITATSGKREFIEIAKREEHSLVYSGSCEALEKIRLLLTFLHKHSQTVRTVDEILEAVRTDGTVSVPLRPAVFYSDPAGGFDGIRMSVFGEISRIGFEMCSTTEVSCDPAGGGVQTRWLFARKDVS